MNTIEKIKIEKIKVTAPRIVWEKYSKYLRHVARRTRYWAEKMNVPIQSIEFRGEGHVRLASFSSTFNKIRLYANIFKIKNIALDGVLVHELSHYFFQHHRKIFYKKIHEFMNNYQDARKLYCAYANSIENKYTHLFPEEECIKKEEDVCTSNKKSFLLYEQWRRDHELINRKKIINKYDLEFQEKTIMYKNKTTEKNV